MFFCRVFIDADKKQYKNYLLHILGEILLPSKLSGAAGGADAGAGGGGDGAEAVPGTEVAGDAQGSHPVLSLRREAPSMLRDGGLIIVDNTLWKGLVLEQVRAYKLV